VVVVVVVEALWPSPRFSARFFRAEIISPEISSAQGEGDPARRVGGGEAADCVVFIGRVRSLQRSAIEVFTRRSAEFPRVRRARKFQ
jgi:hypothetical protein